MKKTVCRPDRRRASACMPSVRYIDLAGLFKRACTALSELAAPAGAPGGGVPSTAGSGPRHAPIWSWSVNA
ncbi:hypothetical protein HUX88_11490 [Duganella sp. BJB1802]|uniref:hypothetical protein n=1 Tax=Duganella sp. BJB1802 TaxID=2744575 RepID=UPI0015937349|nr:hypothetical protein [Duganella sp. BJB1802]NVD71177.1 hypothetical protein [Duganella sp. BJB1802]